MSTCLPPDQTAPPPEQEGLLHAFSFTSDPLAAGWIPTRDDGDAQGLAFLPSEGSYRSKGGGWMGPRIPCQDTPWQFYRLSFDAHADDQGGLWSATFQDALGETIVSDVYSGIDPHPDWQRHEGIFRGREGAATFAIGFHFRGEYGLRNLQVEAVSRNDVLAWADRLYARMPALAYQPQPERWQRLPATRARLCAGTPLRLVMLGDSIVNDTANGNFDALLKRRWPHATVQVVPAVKGCTGCWHYATEEGFQVYVQATEPDLLAIGGISHRNDIDAIHRVIHLARERIGCEMLLMSGPFGHDWRNCADSPYRPPVERGAPIQKPFDSQLEALADAEGIAFLDLGTIWNRYLAASCVPPGWFHRDEIHANDRGKQVLARIMEQFFAPE